ncbi:MAG: alginate lyase family protein [Bdellovibrionales bacterium]|nr:alginate lyase family protein [Bdellovibrionales bacterium]
MQASTKTSSDTNLATYARTLRHLRPKQVLTRIKHRIVGYSDRTAPINVSHFRLDPLRAEPLAPRLNGIRGIRSSGSKITFLSETRTFPQSKAGLESASLLWQFNYHYLDWLWQLEPEDGIAHLLDWLNSNPFASTPAWHPYVVSKRLLNLSVIFRSRLLPLLQDNPQLRQNFAQSVWDHLYFLYNNLEYDVDVNHLLTNLIAGTAGCSLFTEDSQGLKRGFEELLELELNRQFLSDGGHVERSPGYQIELIYQLTHLLNCLASTGSDKLREVITGGLKIVSALSDAAGEPFVFNDGAVEETVLVSDLRNYASRVTSNKALAALTTNQGMQLFPESGYCRIDCGPFALTADFGALGAPHNSGHGHADFLSFILQIDQMPVVVDAGNFDYLPGEKRSYFRSTRAHSTVELNGESCAELWSAFRVGRRSVPRLLLNESFDGWETIVAAHNGYRHLPGNPQVVRRWVCTTAALIIVDFVFGRQSLSSVSRFHIHPMWSLEKNSSSAVLSSKYDSTKIYVSASTEIQIESDHFFSPGFGKAQGSAALSCQVPVSRQAKPVAVVFSLDNIRPDFSALSEHSLSLGEELVSWADTFVKTSGARV